MSRRWTSILVGIGSAILLFIGMFLVSGHLRSDCGIIAVLSRWLPIRSPCFDDIVRVGFPIIMWEDGGFAYRSAFYVSAFLVDLVSVIAVSCAIAVAHAWLRTHPRVS